MKYRFTNRTGGSSTGAFASLNLGLHVTDEPSIVLANRASLVHDVGPIQYMNNTLEVMRDMGSTDIRAIIGPSICGSCYEVSQEIYDEVIALHPAAASRTTHGNVSLDLPAALRAVLTGQGVEIRDEFSCTVENPELFSYRRDGVTGRQAGIISL